MWLKPKISCGNALIYRILSFTSMKIKGWLNETVNAQFSILTD